MVYGNTDLIFAVLAAAHAASGATSSAIQAMAAICFRDTTAMT
jgi:hypothetical protein